MHDLNYVPPASSLPPPYFKQHLPTYLPPFPPWAWNERHFGRPRTRRLPGPKSVWVSGRSLRQSWSIMKQYGRTAEKTPSYPQPYREYILLLFLLFPSFLFLISSLLWSFDFHSLPSRFPSFPPILYLVRIFFLFLAFLHFSYGLEISLKLFLLLTSNGFTQFSSFLPSSSLSHFFLSDPLSHPLLIFPFTLFQSFCPFTEHFYNAVSSFLICVTLPVPPSHATKPRPY